MKIFAYTFRTFSKKEQLKNIFSNLFIFGKLKDDFKIFSREIISSRPDYVIGIASAEITRIESVAVNQFNKNKKIDKNGHNIYQLCIPSSKIFKVSDSATTSFCNWSAYKISKLIIDQDLKTRLVFVHVSDGDIEKLQGFLNDR